MQIYVITHTTNESLISYLHAIVSYHLDSSKVEKQVLKLLAGLLVKTLPHEEGELVSVLAGGGHPHCPGPVVVQMTQLVCQLLEMIWREARVVLDHVIGRGIDGALPHTLRHEEEIIPGKYKKIVQRESEDRKVDLTSRAVSLRHQ